MRYCTVGIPKRKTAQSPVQLRGSVSCPLLAPWLLRELRPSREKLERRRLPARAERKVAPGCLALHKRQQPYSLLALGIDRPLEDLNFRVLTTQHLG